MRLVIVAAQDVTGSTAVGRILPLADYLTDPYEVHYIGLRDHTRPPIKTSDKIHIHYAGVVPFRRLPTGKTRLSGWKLLFNNAASSLRTAYIICRLNPGVIIISKPLPANTLGTYLARLWPSMRHCRVYLDADDFELTSNKLSSFLERAVLHASQRLAIKMSRVIFAATPFLADHYRQFSGHADKVVFLPTGVNPLPPLAPPTQHQTLAYLGSLSVSTGHRIDKLPEILKLVCEKFPDTNLIIAGDGEDTSALKKSFSSKNLGNRVTWLGRFNPSLLSDALNRTSIIIDPIDNSITQRAKSSYRVALAIACGRAVVTANVGIRAYLIPPSLHSRFFASSASPAPYATKIIELINRPLSAAEIDTMRNYAKMYTWSKLASRYLKYIKSE
ncbi:MAG: glycosyltransferase [bacterium]|nr:glycosyltransferase [bacterium]MDZ4344442.1 glycosyltransferase [Candidatus Binatia bacterium]